MSSSNNKPLRSLAHRQSQSEKKSPKNIVFLFDGTANSMATSTHVARLAGMLENSDTQFIYYTSGVGADRKAGVKKILDYVFGIGMTHQLRAAYECLVDKYNPGDQIYIFGFSRGAYLARSLSSLIYCCGILKREMFEKYSYERETLDGEKKSRRDMFISRTLELYQSRNNHPDDDGVVAFRKAYTYNPNTEQDRRVRFVGVWDTVATLGIFSVLSRLSWVKLLCFIFLMITAWNFVSGFDYSFFDNLWGGLTKHRTLKAVFDIVLAIFTTSVIGFMLYALGYACKHKEREKFHSNKIHPFIDFFYQFIASDELRYSFLPSWIFSENKENNFVKNDSRRINKRKYFKSGYERYIGFGHQIAVEKELDGVHADVGGSYARNEVGYQSLDAMLRGIYFSNYSHVIKQCEQLMMQDIDVSEDEVLKALDQFLSPRAEDDEAKIFYQSERKKVSEWRLISTDEIIKKLEKEYQCSFSQNEKITKYKKYQERLSAFQKVFSIGFIEEDNYNDNDFKKTPANNREQKFHEIIHNRMETTLKACPVNDYTLNRNLTKGQALRFNKDNKKDFLNRYWENECFHDQCNQLRSKCCDNKCPDCLAENSAKNHHRHPIHYRCCQHDRQLSPCIIKDEPLLKRNYKDMNNSVRLKDFLFFLLIDRKSFEENWIVKLRDKILLFSKDFSKCHPRNSIDESSLYPQYKLLFILKPLRTVGTFITNFVFWLFSPFLFVCFLYSSRKKQKATLIINYALYPALIGLAFWLFNEEASQAFETLTKIPFWFFEKSSNWWFEISPFAC